MDADPGAGQRVDGQWVADQRVDGQRITAWLTEFGRLIEENVDLLTQLDAAIGDGDHGANMRRGMRKVMAALAASEPGGTVAAVTKKAATTLISTVGGASGPLYGTFFLRFAAAANENDLTTNGFGRALRSGVDGVVQRGKAAPGDKTMVDAWVPACTAFEQTSQQGLTAALTAAALAAARGRDATRELVARKGRASYLGERSIGHIDPGATSTALLLQAAPHTLAGAR